MSRPRNLAAIVLVVTLALALSVRHSGRYGRPVLFVGRLVPAETGCPGGCRYELKWDGYRIALVRSAKGVRLWSRRGSDLTVDAVDLLLQIVNLALDLLAGGKEVVDSVFALEVNV